MALVIKDRVKETTTTTGTGSYTLAGAEAGFQSFSVIGDGNTTYYACTDGTDFEVGIGTYTASGTQLSRTTILSSSDSDATVDWSAGEKLIFVTQPAAKANYLDVDGYVTGTEVKTHLDLNTTVANKPSYAEGRLFYDKTNGSLGFYNDESDITLQVGQEQYIRVYNNTASTIGNGTPVYLTGESGTVPTVSPANASGTYEQSQAVGLATHSIEASTYGYVTVHGLVGDIDTSHLSVGEHVHVGITAGTTQEASPTYPNFPTEIGLCLISNASTGCIYVSIQTHAFQSFRSTGNSHFDADVTIQGDLTVNGTQTITNSNNIALSGAFQYLNSGDTISSPSFTGTGLNDASFTGHYTGTTSNKVFYVKIDSSHGNDDTFKWSTDNFVTTEASLITITGDDQALEDGISVKFNASSGHTVNEQWTGQATPVEVDTGIGSNRNTGTTGVGYTHVGMYYDVSTNYWTFFDEYSPEPTGTIDVSHASFSYGDIKANSFIGILAGNANSSSVLANPRTISLSGDASGSVSFDGSADVDITVTVANDSHTHDTRYVQKSGDTMTGALEVPTVDLGDWTITEDSGSLFFKYQGTNKFKLDNTGTLSVTNDVQTDDTI